MLLAASAVTAERRPAGRGKLLLWAFGPPALLACGLLVVALVGRALVTDARRADSSASAVPGCSEVERRAADAGWARVGTPEAIERMREAAEWPADPVRAGIRGVVRGTMGRAELASLRRYTVGLRCASDPAAHLHRQRLLTVTAQAQARQQSER